MKRTRDYPKELKRLAISRLEGGERPGDVARELGIDRQRLYDWHHRYRLGGLAALRGRGRPSQEEVEAERWSQAGLLDEGALARQRIAELERKVGQQTADLDFFRQALRHVKARRQEAAGGGGLRFTRSSKR